jgi:hypothetical protein
MALVAPVFDDFVDKNMPGNATVIGHLFAVVPWITFFEDMLVEDTEEIAVQIASPCGTDFRLVVYGDEAETVDVDEWDYVHLKSLRRLLSQHLQFYTDDISNRSV